LNVHAAFTDVATSAPFPRVGESKTRLRFWLIAGLMLTDCVALISSFWLSNVFRFEGIVSHDRQYLLGAFLPIFLISAGMAKAHTARVLLKRSEAVVRVLYALGIATLVAALVIFFLQTGTYISRLYFGVGVMSAAVLLPVSRYIFVGYASRRLNHSLHSVVELRDGLRSLSRGEMPSFDTSSFFDPTDPTPNSLNRLAQLVAEVDRVVVSCPEERRGAWAHVLQGMNVHGEITLPSIGTVRPLGIDSFMGKATLLVGRGPLTLPERCSKRIMDLTISLGAILAFWPLLVCVALAVKLTSPGPIIFKQPRIGRQNRLFYIWKFRSMHVANSDSAGEQSTSRDDARITPIGKLIRKTSIDELPQLFNVLIGDMSIVGPRPHAVSSRAENRLFWEIDNRYWHRHACKPGLTGLAQVRGFRGSTLYVKDITDRLSSDLEYLASWSLWRDLMILVQTVKVLFHKNAF
jgi:exopolysaccharide biosynthesis polyprenyl glycosylphosphotransferase